MSIWALSFGAISILQPCNTPMMWRRPDPSAAQWHMRHWAVELEVSDLLERAFSKVFENETK